MNNSNSTKKQISFGNNKSISSDDTNKKRKYKSTLSQKGIRTIICHGCKLSFTKFKNIREFIDRHGCSNVKCKQALFECFGCNMMFYTESDRTKHWKTRKNHCLKKHNTIQIPKNYATSQVEIPTLKETSKSTDVIDLTRNTLKFSHLLRTKKFCGINTFMVNGMSKEFIRKKKYSMNKHVNLKSDNSNTLCELVRNDISVEKEINDDTQMTLFATDEDDLNSINDDSLHSPTVNSSPSQEHISDIIDNTINMNESDVQENNDDNQIMTDNESNENEIINLDEMNEDNYESGEYESDEEVLILDNVIDYPKQRYVIETSNHLNRLKNSHTMELSNLNCDTSYKDGLELIQILMKKKIPLTSYNDFMNWKYQSTKTSNSYYSFEALKKKAEYRVYGKTLQNKMSPKTTLLECPSGRKVNVVTYDLDAIIYDLLSDTELTCWKNLIFKDGNENDPFLWNTKDFYDDFDQSTYYNETFKKMIGYDKMDTHLLVPIAIYMDETTLDSYGKLSLHPVCITLMIYDRSTRNLEMSWRTIGYMPNINAIAGTKSLSAEDKLNDFHYVLRYILYGIEQIQSVHNGLEWEFKFPEFAHKSYKRILKFPLSHVVGDAKGNDTLVGRFQNRTKTKLLCRDCDCPTVQADNPNIVCNFLQYNDLKCLTRNELEMKSFRKLQPYNAFDNISMGSYPYGLNGGTPADPCHQVNKGVCEVLPNVLLKERLTIEMVKTLDSHVSYLVTNFSRQSDRSLPELRFFGSGVSEDSKLSSNENIGRLFAIYLTLMTRDFEKRVVGKKGRKSDKSTPATVITQNEYNQWILIFEETLILTAWVYHNKHPKVVFNGGKKSIACERMKEYMTLFKQVANRKTGMGLKLLKFHQLLHLWFIIRAYGSLSNIDSARNESHHKKKKKIASHTQKRFNVLEHQTAEHEYTYNLFIKAMKNSFMEIPDLFEMKVGEDKDEEENDFIVDDISKKTSTGSKFILSLDYTNKKMIARSICKNKKGEEIPFPPHILQALYTKLESYNHGIPGRQLSSVEGFTEFKHAYGSENVIFRVCPEYRSGLHWFDWAVLNWGESYGNLPAQLLIFIDVNTMKFEELINAQNIDHEPHVVLPHHLMVLVHSIAADASRRQRKPALCEIANSRSVDHGPIVKCSSFSEMENSYQLVGCDTIVKQVFVLVDEARPGADLRVPGSAKNVIVVKNWDDWHLSFLDYNSQSLLDDASLRVDNDISDNSARYAYEG